MPQDKYILDLEEKILHLEKQLEAHKAQLSKKHDKIHLLEALLDESPSRIYTIDGDLFSYVNKSFAKAFGYNNPFEIIDKIPVMDFIAPESRELVSRNIQKRHSGECDEIRYKFSAICKDGSCSQVEVHGHSISFGSHRQVAGILLDITHYRAISELAYYDPLTKLPNRALFMNKVNKAVRRALRDNERFSIMFIDLDEFKEVNDNAGHAAGDFVLQQSAKRISELIHDADTVSRVGGDEFIVLRHCDNKDACAKLAAEMIQRLENPVRFCNRTVSVGASIGISVFPDDGTDPAAIIQAADWAMYEAKRHGKRTFAFATPTKEK